jgi:DNA-binding transcriptional ArsR family regulator
MEVYDALADPTRREILQRLREEGPLSVSEVAAPLPMTRQAATRHLDVLSDAGLVRTRREGRRRMHELDARPLRKVDRWLTPFAAEWDRRLGRLERHLGRDTAPTTDHVSQEDG